MAPDQPTISTDQYFDLKIRVLGGEVINISAPGEMRIADLIKELTEALNLPVSNSIGEATIWRLDNKLHGRVCDPTSTVGDEVARKPGVELTLTRAVVAG